jgi:prepilin-type N-terminal cleavage/methylation domain-containing protein
MMARSNSGFNVLTRQTLPPSGQRGLTLVEMLIALVLSSIIFISAYQVISNLVQYQVRARVQQDRDLNKLLVTNLLSQIIEKGVSQLDLFNRNQKSALFAGTTDSLQLISRAYSDRYDKPGHRVYQLFQRDGELHITYRAFDSDYRSNQRFELASGLKLENLNFAYFEDGDWIDEWHDEKSIPEFVRIRADLAELGPAEWIRGTNRR